jgi:type VI secretion system FHA domain protein
MSLALSAIRHADEKFANPVTTPLAAARCTIGRGRECDIVLEDPERHVSRVHATITARGEASVLTVSSRVNSVIINGNVLTAGQSTVLSAGDEVTIGDYVFMVVLDSSAMQAGPATASPDALETLVSARAPSPIDSLFGPDVRKRESVQPARSSIDEVLGAKSARHDDPLLNALGGTSGPAPAESDISPLGRDTSDPLMQLLGHGAAPGSTAIAPSFGVSGSPDGASGVSSLDELLGAGPAPAADPLGLAPTDHRANSRGFGGGRGGSLELDHVHDVNLPLNLPSIPQRDTASSPSPSVRPPSSRQVGSAPPAHRAPATPDDPLAALLGESPHAKSGQSSASVEDPLALLSDFKPSQLPPTAASPDLDANISVARGGASNAASPAVSIAQAVAIFLEGAGMQGINIADAQSDAFLRDCGAVCRVAVEGLMGLLLARATVRQELRARDRTMVAARKNNPLKLMESAEEAVRFVLDPSKRSEAFLSPSKAITDACNDLRAHEIALVAGMRSALLGAIKRFDPVQMEKLLEEQGGVSVIENTKAKLWECFIEYYEKTIHDAGDNFDKVFGADFLRAYQEQLKRLQKK